MLNDHLSRCRLCPRLCEIDRHSGKTGYCGAGDMAKLFRYDPHPGEEPPISAQRGSGTVFFSNCTLRCTYCQNHPWSLDGEGEDRSVTELANIFTQLHSAGCHNWNLVSPTPWLPMIKDAIDKVNRKDVALPVVYNTSGYERMETLREFGDIVDVYLTDLRYSRSDTARAISDAANYPGVARAAIEEMWLQKGKLTLDAEGAATSGVICRLLILPGHPEDAVENLQWLAAGIGPEIDVSIMAQYTPTIHTKQQPWNRHITRDEYDLVCSEAEKLGFTNGWTQEYSDHADDALAGYRMKPG